MTLSQPIMDALKELDAAHDARFAPWRNQWQTIRTELHSLSDVEYRLEAANALLSYCTAFMAIRHSDMYDAIQSHLQGAGDEA